MSYGPDKSQFPPRIDVFPEGVHLPPLYTEDKLCLELQDFLSGAIKCLWLTLNVTRRPLIFDGDELMLALAAFTGRGIDDNDFNAMIKGERPLSAPEVNEFAGALGIQTKNIFQQALIMKRMSNRPADDGELAVRILLDQIFNLVERPQTGD